MSVHGGKSMKGKHRKLTELEDPFSSFAMGHEVCDKGKNHYLQQHKFINWIHIFCYPLDKL